MANGYLSPKGAAISAGNSKTFDRGLTNLLIKNSGSSLGNVTITYYNGNTVTGTYTIEPGDLRTWNSGAVMFDKIIAACAAGTTAYWEYLE